MSFREETEARFEQGWLALKGQPYREVPVMPPVFSGHPRYARPYSLAIILFAIRVFHNREEEYYELANRKITENCRFYCENTDVRDDRDSFYWNIGELCRVILHFGKNGDEAPGLVSAEAEEAFREMAFGYCHDMSKLTDAECDGNKTWRVYESENHHVQRDSALWQLMHILLDDPACAGRRMADGGTLREHYDAWTAFFKAWIRERAGKSMFIEVRSRCYGVHTIKNVYPLYDMSEDEELRTLAGNLITLFWAVWAQEQLNGIDGGGQSRVYPDSARSTDSEAADWAYYYTGRGTMKPPRAMEYVMLDSRWRMPETVVRLAAGSEMRGVYEIEMHPLGHALPEDHYPDYRPDPEDGRIYRYSYCTPDFIVGTQMYPQAPQEQWCGIHTQNRFHGVIYGVPGAELLPIPEPTGMHSLQSTEPTLSYNSFWSMQAHGTLLTQKNRFPHRTGRMRVWFSEAGGLSDVKERDGWFFTGCGNAYSAVRVCRGGYSLHKAGPDEEYSCRARGKWLYPDDEWSPVITETARACDHASFEDFIAAVCALVPEWDGDVMRYTGLYGDVFVMKTDGTNDSTINGAPYVKAEKVSFRSPFVNMPWKGRQATVTFGGESLTLDF